MKKDKKIYFIKLKILSLQVVNMDLKNNKRFKVRNRTSLKIVTFKQLWYFSLKNPIKKFKLIFFL